MTCQVTCSTSTASIAFDRPTLEGALALGVEFIAAKVPPAAARIVL
jgi:hypothetical protein